MALDTQQGLSVTGETQLVKSVTRNDAGNGGVAAWTVTMHEPLPNGISATTQRSASRSRIVWVHDSTTGRVLLTVWLEDTWDVVLAGCSGALIDIAAYNRKGNA